ncbi:MAG: AAA family ATPase [Pseudomonadota bacterium]
MFQDLDIYLRSAVESEFFMGGLALGAIGAAIALLRLVWGILSGIASRRLWLSVTLDNRTSAHRNFSVWLDQNGVLAHAKRLRMTRLSGGRSALGPDMGDHWFWRNGHFCRLSRTLSEKTKVGQVQKPMETYTIRVLFGRRDLIEDWIAEGDRLSQVEPRIGPGIHILRYDYWDSIGDVPRRSIDTVLSDDDRLQRLLTDVRWFYGASDWYADRGVPWRRGYLLHGPPGTGKTSAIRAIASELKLDIATLDLGRVGLTDDALREAMLTAPREAVMAIEDIDAAFRERKGESLTITFSGLLNAIDGVASQEGRALFMTTNHPERLDPALIRPGRADVHVELGLVGPDTAADLFRRFFPDRGDLADRFRDVLAGRRFAPAALQGWLMKHNSDPEAAAAATDLVPTLLAAE